MPTPASHDPHSSSPGAEKRWAILRVALGLLQVFGASLSLVLLLTTGVSPVSLTAAALTCLCTTASVLLFGSRSPARRR